MKDFVTREWFRSETGIAPEQLEDFWPLESNVIPCTDGKLRCLLRLESIPYAGYTLLLEMSDDGKVLKLDERCNGLVEMPTTISKFKVCYDEGTGLYLALANVPSLPIPYSTRGSTPMSGQRNQLALVASPDLINWKTIDVVLTDRAVMNASASARAHGFQYVIWDVDGDDMVFVVREAYGNTKTYHDGGAVTLYRLADYQKLVKERYPQEEFWKNPSRKK